MRLYTIGYSRKSPEGVMETLKRERVGLILDVRLNPASRDPRWDRSEVERVAQVAGIRYQWCRGLGNPFYPKGQAVGAQQGREILQRYHAHLCSDPGAAASLRWLAGLLTPTGTSARPTICLFCLCAAHTLCHRGVICDELVRLVPTLEIERL